MHPVFRVLLFHYKLISIYYLKNIPFGMHYIQHYIVIFSAMTREHSFIIGKLLALPDPVFSLS